MSIAQREPPRGGVNDACAHSAGLREEVVTRREERQEGEVHEENDGPRAQTTPLPRTRPAPLPVVAGSQGVWLGAPRQPGSVVPSGVPPALAAPAAETVDAAALSVLLAQSLAAQQQEEAEVKEQAAVAELVAQVAAAGDRLLVQLQGGDQGHSSDLVHALPRRAGCCPMAPGQGSGWEEEGEEEEEEAEDVEDSPVSALLLFVILLRFSLVWFYSPLYLAVTYSRWAFRRSAIRGLFSVFSSSLGSTVDTFYVSLQWPCRPRSTRKLGFFQS